MFFYVLLPLLIVILVGGLYYKKFFGGGNLETFDQEETEILEILVPKKNEDDSKIDNSDFAALSAEHLFASLHGLLKEDAASQEHFSFEVVANAIGLKFYVTAPRSIIKFVESQVYAQYPKAQMKVVYDYAKPSIFEKTNYETGYFALANDYYFPVKVFRDFEIDPLANLVSSLSEVADEEGIWLQFLIKPVPDGWQEPGHAYLKEMMSEPVGKFDWGIGKIFSAFFKEFFTIFADIPGVFFTNEVTKREDSAAFKKPDGTRKLTSFEQLSVDAVENKLAKMGYEVVIRIVAHSQDSTRLQNNIRSVAAAFKQFTNTTLNSFVLVRAEDKSEFVSNYISRVLTPDETLILNNEELATVFHLPSSRDTAPNVSWVFSKMGEPPSNLPVEDATYIGDTLFRGKKVRFGLRNDDDRLRHMYLIGKTGTGKSTLLETMITQDIKNGQGVGVLDPHGETIDKILERIPDDRIDDVILFDPSDSNFPVGLNLLEMDDPTDKNLMASALLSAIKQHFDYSWGPRLEYLLNYAILTLLEVPGTTILGITRLLEDTNYQNYILHKVKDPVIIKFWEQEYKEMRSNQKLVTEAVAPIQNKVNRFLASTTIRNILCQQKSTIDLADIMQSRKILLMNLSKGKIGSDNANLLGALLVSRIQFMALQRAKIPYDERVPFYLYVDEFQNFATGSFEEILSESRKYKLGLYLTHQYTEQLPEALLKGVFGNVGTIATFSLGAPDARVLASEFAPYFDHEDIISLERFHVYIKLMIDGMTSLPFSAKIILPWLEDTDLIKKTGNKERIIERSREQYGVESTFVEDVISRWVKRPFDKGLAIAEEHKEKGGIENKNDIK